MRKLMVTVMVLVGVSALCAQTGPAWVPQGNLPGADVVRDMVEIPNSQIVIAVGRDKSGSYYYPAVWRSTDGGTNWTIELTGWGCDGGDCWKLQFRKVIYDSSANIIFTVGLMAGDDEYKTVRYSTDYGDNWSYAAHPDIIGYGNAYSAVILDGFLYVVFDQQTGARYTIPVLLALDYSDPNPSNWTWYFVKQYPQLTLSVGYYEPVLAVKDGKLYVMGRDRTTDAIRIYTYEPSKLESMMKPIGTVSEMEEYWKKHKDELKGVTFADSTSADPVSAAR